MSDYPPYYYAPPSYATPVYPPTVYPPHGYTAQACNSSAYGAGMQPVPNYTVQMHHAQPPPVPERWIRSDEPLPLPRHTSRRNRYESEAFKDDGYPAPQSSRNNHSQMYGRYSTPLQQPLPPRKAIEYQDQEQEDDEHAYHSDYSAATFTDSEEFIETRDYYRKEPKTSTRSRRVFTKDGTSMPEHSRRYIGS